MKTLAEELQIGLESQKKHIDDSLSKQEAAHKEAMDKVQARIKQLEDELEAGTYQRTGISVPGSDYKPFSFAKLFKGMVFERIDAKAAWKGAEHEREVVKEATQKALSAGVDTGGGFLVPVEVMEKEFIELLRPKLVFEALGVRFLSGLSGSPVEIPGQAGGATPFWVGENEALTASQQSFDIKEMYPKRAGVLVKVSNRLLSSAIGSVESLIRDDMVQTMARHLEAGVLFGNSTKQPRGLVHVPGTNPYVIGNPNGGVFDFDDADNMIGLIEDADADRLGPIKFLFVNAVKRRLKQLKVAHFAGQSSEQSYLLGTPPSSDMSLRETLGYEFHTTNQIPRNLVKGSSTNLSYVIAGVWQELLVGWWRNMIFKTSSIAGDATGSAFTQNQTWMILEMEVDSQVRHEQAFSIASDAVA